MTFVFRDSNEFGLRQAFVVAGPESSGNRFMVQLLVDAGCAGVAGDAQPFDRHPGYGVQVPDPKPDAIALHRSFPHATFWPDLPGILRFLRGEGYRVKVVVMARDPDVVEKSQLKAGHVKTIVQAREAINSAYKAIFAGLAEVGCGYVLVPYRALERGKFRSWLGSVLGLPGEMKTAFIDGDAKYEAVP